MEIDELPTKLCSEVPVTSLVILPDFTNEITKSLVNVNTFLCGRLCETAPKLLSEIAAL